MKIIHVVPPGSIVSIADVHQGAERFYFQFKVKPTVVRMSLYDSGVFIKNMNSYNSSPVLVLEEGKKYANFINTGLGPLRLDILEEEDTGVSFGYAAGQSSPNCIIVIENTEIDVEFEKHVLNEGK